MDETKKKKKKDKKKRQKSDEEGILEKAEEQEEHVVGNLIYLSENLFHSFHSSLCFDSNFL